MGRDAAKSVGNVWRDARLNAARYNEELSSQEKVAAKLGFGVDAIRRIETDTNKIMPVDSAVLLADLYNAPELLNHYCLHECPIGARRSISDSAVNIDRATVKITQALRKETVQKIKYGLQDIAKDGVISEDEYEDFDAIIDELKEISKIISELEIIRDKGKRETRYEN